jgi:hypothetical protein
MLRGVAAVPDRLCPLPEHQTMPIPDWQQKRDFAKAPFAFRR